MARPVVTSPDPDPVPIADEADVALIKLAKKRFKKCSYWESVWRGRFIEDVKFCNADSRNMYQWPQTLRDARGYGTSDERPCLTINKTEQHCLQIINDSRQNKTSIKIKPVGDGATYEAAQVHEGIVRHIEYISNAQAQYTRATTFQVQGGIGYCRVLTKYADDTSFDQEIYIQALEDPLSVYMDPDATEPDGSDAKFGFIFADVDREEFEAQYPDVHIGQTSSVLGNDESGWIGTDKVRIAEYYYRSEVPDELIVFVDPENGEKRPVKRSELKGMSGPLLDAFREQMDDIATKRRPIKGYEVKWVKIAGDQIVERADWAGDTIPIAFAIGKKTIIDGELDIKGHTRCLIDPQNMYNYNAPLSLSTPIPTPTGWTTMGEIEAGDTVFDENGQPTTVLGTSPVFVHSPCYRVEFDDGSHIIADERHKWTVERRGKRKTASYDWQKITLPTSELLAGRDFVETSKPIQTADVSLPIDPYILGVWLGDGSAATGRIASSIDDAESMGANLMAAGASIDTRVFGASSAATIRVHGLTSQLRRAGILGRKTIPDAYLRASRDQRIALLQGLMDTDGGISRATHQCVFTNGNEAIISRAEELLHSLGIKVTKALVSASARMFPGGNVCETQALWRLTFHSPADVPVFKLSRKVAIQCEDRPTHWRRTRRFGIKSITSVASEPTRCIGVDSASHLFLAGPSMIPTHNSAAIEYGALQGKSPYLAPVAAIGDLDAYWGRQNLDNLAWLPWNHKDDDGNDIPAPVRQTPPMGAPVYQQGMQNAAQDMMLVSGQYQATMGEPSNEKSGKAIMARQRQGENATYHFIDNQALMIRRIGKIIVQLIPKIYDTPRIMKILGEDGSDSDVFLDPDQKEAFAKRQSQDRESAEQIVMNPTIGRYDVMSDPGPDYATRRQEAFNALSQIAENNKELMPIIGDLVMMNADFPGADEMAERLQRMVPAQALGDGPNPQVVELQKQLDAAQNMLGAMSVKIQEYQNKAVGRDAQKEVDVYKALTDRLDVLMKYSQIPARELLAFQHSLAMQEHASNLVLAEKTLDDSLSQQGTTEAVQ